MKILLIGSTGQLGCELAETCPENIELEKCDFPQIDLRSLLSIEKCINAAQPGCIINAAAYTDVDRAETRQEEAFKINHAAVSHMARIAADSKIQLIHISTDFFFDGKSYRPYLPEDEANPLSVYGLSKLEGEKAVKNLLGTNALIIRTAWLYSSHGKNFVKTMISMMKKGNPLSVIDEQIGTPTWARGLAKAVWVCIEKQITGIHHWTDAGVASWYDFACAIREEACWIGLIPEDTPQVMPVSTSRYPTAAARPAFSVLDKRSMWQATGITPLHWRVQLRSMLKEMAR
jgi:dTDP-4-dehydrorhamnose reductase